MIDKCPVYSEAMLKMQAKYMAGAKEHNEGLSAMPMLAGLIHAQQEAIDLVFYLEKLIQDLEKNPT